MNKEQEVREIIKPFVCIYKGEMACLICSIRGCGIDKVTQSILALDKVEETLLHKIWFEATNTEISITIAKGLKAIANYLNGR